MKISTVKFSKLYQVFQNLTVNRYLQLGNIQRNIDTVITFYKFKYDDEMIPRNCFHHLNDYNFYLIWKDG